MIASGRLLQTTDRLFSRFDHCCGVRSPPGFTIEHIAPPPPWLWVGLAISIAAAAPLALQIGRGAERAQHGARGELTIVGSRSMTDHVARWTALYRRRYPFSVVNVELVGSGAAAGALADGNADVVTLARSFAPGEIGIAQRSGARPNGFLLGYHGHDPVFLYVTGRGPKREALDYIDVALNNAGQMGKFRFVLPPVARTEELRRVADLKESNR